MRVARLAVAAAGVFGLVAAGAAGTARAAGPARRRLRGASALAASAPAVLAPAASTLAGVVVRPGVIHAGQAHGAQAAPPGTAACLQDYRVAATARPRSGRLITWARCTPRG